ncbi:MAG: class I SAM-dependent RNA methyltransferase [Oscillospiraceae bacterium]|nr:class I SAM-dependent RNA methyltransferase [Oscillospiraceae bacterium]
MNNIKMVCPCLFGLESVLTRELKYIDAQNIKATDGKVFFEGSFETLIDANINLRTAERVLIVMNEFKATSFEELYQGVFLIDWGNFINKNDKFPVKGWTLNSVLKSEPACQSIIKKAVVEKLKKTYKTSWFEETGALYQIQFSIQKDNVLIMLDTSGAGLHKRGYRKSTVLAPIKETLAAGIVSLSRVNSKSSVCDPCCGSGTLLIESALWALKIAPGLNRRFVAEDWNAMSDSDWNLGRQRAISKINKDSSFMAFGSDIDPEAIEIAKINAKRAGISSRINFQTKSIQDLEFLDFKNSQDFEKSNFIVLTNPPYGERLLEVNQAREIYKLLGQKFLNNNLNNNLYVISPDEDFEKILGSRATKRRKLYNGMIKCQLYMYF